jgi:hypothetical protein
MINYKWLQVPQAYLVSVLDPVIEGSSKGPNKVGVSLNIIWRQTDLVSETLCFLVI